LPAAVLASALLREKDKAVRAPEFAFREKIFVGLQELCGALMEE
jgi:hypothetical protein